MNLKVESLPVIALLIVISFMIYANVIIISDIGRMISLIPLVIILLMWLAAILKLRRSDDVR